MADVAEIVEEVPAVEKEKEKEVEKKVVDVEAEDKSNDEPAAEPKENGDSAKNGDSKSETNGVSEETATNKRKSGAADAPEAAVDGTPEKKAKIVAEENDESNSTNGSTEVAA